MPKQAGTNRTGTTRRPTTMGERAVVGARFFSTDPNKAGQVEGVYLTGEAVAGFFRAAKRTQ
jgi:hypothetical protein